MQKGSIELMADWIMVRYFQTLILFAISTDPVDCGSILIEIPFIVSIQEI